MSEAPRASAPLSPLPPRYLADLLATGALLYLLPTIAPLISAGSPGANEALSILVTLLFTGLAVLLIAQLAKWPLPAPGEAAVALAAVVIYPLLTHLAGRGPIVRLYLHPLVNLCFILICVMAGRLLSRILRERNILLPVGLVAMFADIFTVFLGPTGRALEVAPKLVEKFSVALPAAGSAVGPHGAAGLTMLAAMGVGDFVFLALFLTSAARFGFPLRRSSILITVLLWFAMVTYLLLPLVHVDLPGIPLLPFIAGGFLLAYRKQFRLTPSEKQGLIWGGLLLLAILGAAAWALHRPGPAPANSVSAEGAAVTGDPSTRAADSPRSGQGQSAPAQTGPATP